MSLQSVRKAGLFVVAALLIAATSYELWRVGWPLAPRLIDQVDQNNVLSDSAPIIVVGILKADTLVRAPVPQHSDPTYPLQLRNITVQVENVLKGDSIPDNITAYYFALEGGINGPRPMGFWRVGGRRVFGLRRDSGVFRTICDGWD